jgi:hypothetical protein
MDPQAALDINAALASSDARVLTSCLVALRARCGDSYPHANTRAIAALIADGTSNTVLRLVRDLHDACDARSALADDPECVAAALACVRPLCWTDAGRDQVVRDAIAPVVVATMGRFATAAHVLAAACNALTAVSSDDAGALQCVAAGAVPALVAALSAFPDDSALLCAGALALCNLSNDNNTRAAVVDDAAAVAAVCATLLRLTSDAGVAAGGDVAEAIDKLTSCTRRIVVRASADALLTTGTIVSLLGGVPALLELMQAPRVARSARALRDLCWLCVEACRNAALRPSFLDAGAFRIVLGVLDAARRGTLECFTQACRFANVLCFTAREPMEHGRFRIAPRFAADVEAVCVAITASVASSAVLHLDEASAQALHTLATIASAASEDRLVLLVNAGMADWALRALEEHPFDTGVTIGATCFLHFLCRPSCAAALADVHARGGVAALLAILGRDDAAWSVDVNGRFGAKLALATVACVAQRLPAAALRSGPALLTAAALGGLTHVRDRSSWKLEALACVRSVV